jgi:hypothetical protein
MIGYGLYIHSAWASRVARSTLKGMLEPRWAGRVTEKLPRFFHLYEFTDN